jgi:hypothetical protein
LIVLSDPLAKDASSGKTAKAMRGADKTMAIGNPLAGSTSQPMYQMPNASSRKAVEMTNCIASAP